MSTTVSSHAPTLAANFRQTKGFLATVFAQLDGGDPAFTAGGVSTMTIPWLVGHFAVCADHLTNACFGIRPVSPRSYLDHFLFARRGDAVADYPPIPEMLSVFDRALDALIDRLETVTDEELAQPLPDWMPIAGHFANVHELLMASIWHYGYHAGQITLLRRAQSLPGGFGM